MNRFKKHIGEGTKREIDGEEFVFKPLGTKYLPEFFMAMKNFSGAKEGASTEEMLKNINEEGLKAISKLIDATLTISFPEEPEEDRRVFGMKYMGELIGIIFEINSADVKDTETIKKVRALQQIREKQAKAKADDSKTA